MSMLATTQLPHDQQPCTQNYNCIDLIKFICAILVFTIHIPPFRGDLNPLQTYINYGLQHSICRIAVPFYFVCSAFFLFKKMPLDNLNVPFIRNYCFKIIRLIGVWYVVLFVGGQIHFWYLSASVVAIILISLCFYYHIKYQKIIALALILYAIGLLGDSYYGIIEPLTKYPLFNYVFKGYQYVFTTTRNGIFMGFIFVLMGALLSQGNMKIKPSLSLLGFIISSAFLLFEAYMLKHNNLPAEYNMYISLLPAVFFLFCFASSIKLPDHPIYKHLRKIGVLIYFSHLLIRYFVILAIRALQKLFHIDLLPYLFIPTLLLTIAFAILIDWLSGKKRFKWINYLSS